VDVIERIGGVLFYAVAGHPLADAFADAPSLHRRLRSLRPDLSSAAAELIVQAVCARRSGLRTLDAFTRQLRHALGIAVQSERPRPRRSIAMIGAAAALAALVTSAGWMRARASDRAGSHGLTASETALIDITEETAQGLALMDEHTAAIQEYQQLARWLSLRTAPDDPRLAWNSLHEAWVRTLRGDRLTTEQLLGSIAIQAGASGGATSRLEAALGGNHPYTRAARLELAATLDARGATTQAAALRKQSEDTARELIGDARSRLGGVPAPPGVVAHLAPNAPEHEGFRRADDDSFFVPLTSIQRMLAGRDGWRLHLTARGACLASVVIGNLPRRVSVEAARTTTGSWQLRVGGVNPPLAIETAPADTASISLIAAGASLEARSSDGQTATSRIDEAAAAPHVPYSMTFGDPDACRLVWLEIPVPYEPPS
jgi:hypothetical protein